MTTAFNHFSSYVRESTINIQVSLLKHRIKEKHTVFVCMCMYVYPITQVIRGRKRMERRFREQNEGNAEKDGEKVISK